MRTYFPPIETHLVCSRHVAQTFRIQVMQPAVSVGESTRFPVVYATDGNFAFDVLKGISWSMQRSERDAPRFILVGIGYPGDSPLAGAVLRARDLTFSGYPRLSLSPPPVEGVLLPEPGSVDFQGAAHFQQFIRHELIPLVDEHYVTIPGERTYFGHSAGGGFGLFTLFTQADLFRRYIVSSPGLSYHGESSAAIHYNHYDFALDLARGFIASHKPLPDVKLYMSVGSEEESEPNLSQWQLTSSFHRMVALLRRADTPGLQLTTEVLNGETHMTAWPVSFIHGIKAVLGTRHRLL